VSHESINLVARRTVIASIAYYGLDTPVMTDAIYDEYSKRLAAEWDDLPPLLKWKLGDSPEAVSASGFQMKCTHADIGGLTAWLQRLKLFRYRLAVPSTKHTVTVKEPDGTKRKVWFTTVGNISWDMSKPIH